MKEVKMETEEARKLEEELKRIVKMLEKMDRKLDEIKNDLGYLQLK